MPDIFDKYEELNIQQISRVSRKIKDVYKESILRISFQVKSIRLDGKLFDLDKFPVLKRAVERELLQMRSDIYSLVLNSIENSWNLSNQKNDLILDKRIPKKNLPAKAATILYDPNEQALKQFIDRKRNGMKLSDRVWNLVQPFKNELEQSIGLAVSEGRSAQSLALEIQKYLVDPDKLFRRVRSEDGALKLSKAAREYNPGKGVYRSSYKNALRLARTETNIAYRTADFERWSKMPFVTGIQVRLSNAHPKYDICDVLAGVYPKDFKFTGWHPQCLCHAVPIMMNDDEYNKIEDQLLAGKQIVVPNKILVKNPPSAFGEYLKENKDRIKAWKNKPYWIADNKKYVK